MSPAAVCPSFSRSVAVWTNIFLQSRIAHLYCINLPDAVTLGGAYDAGEASPVGVYELRVTRDLLKRAVSLQQRRRLFTLEAKSQHNAPVYAV